MRHQSHDCKACLSCLSLMFLTFLLIRSLHTNAAQFVLGPSLLFLVSIVVSQPLLFLVKSPPPFCPPAVCLRMRIYEGLIASSSQQSVLLLLFERSLPQIDDMFVGPLSASSGKNRRCPVEVRKRALRGRTNISSISAPTPLGSEEEERKEGRGEGASSVGQ